ncbi:hypothetical protein V8F20_004975 [Naviculisporaceae sp. PSN 640]
MVHQGTNWKINIINGVVWIAVSGLFVWGRFITRLTLRADRLGYDDWTLVAGWLFFVIQWAFWIASLADLDKGWDFLSIAMDESQWHYDELLAGLCYFFVFIGYALVKLSVAMFLIRLTVVRWHKILLWFMSITFGLFSIAVGSILLYCNNISLSPIYHPPQRAPDGTEIPWNDSCSWASFKTTNGMWIWAIIFDFFLAIFPWFLLWKVHMKRSKKLVICISLSLGAIAGAIGIKRVLVYYTIVTSEDLTWVFFWGMIEYAVGMICVSIPALLPLWNRVVHKKRHGGGVTVGRKRAHAPGPAAAVVEDPAGRKRRSGEVYDPRFESLLAETVPTHHETVGNGTVAQRTRATRTGREMETVDEKMGSTTTNTTSSGVGSGGGVTARTSELNGSQSGDSSLEGGKETAVVHNEKMA